MNISSRVELQNILLGITHSISICIYKVFNHWKQFQIYFKIFLKLWDKIETILYITQIYGIVHCSLMKTQSKNTHSNPQSFSSLNEGTVDVRRSAGSKIRSARRSALAKLYKDMNFVLLFEINFQKRSKLIKFSHFDLK